MLAAILAAIPYALPAYAIAPNVSSDVQNISGQGFAVAGKVGTSLERLDFSVTQTVPNGYRVYAQTADTFVNNPNSAVQWPFTQGVPISSGFGYRSCRGCSSYHDGLDMNPGIGTPVGAIAKGTVEEVGGPSGTMGSYVILDHKIDGQNVSSIYAHMIPGSTTVKKGDIVTVGQQIGLVGKSGVVTGPHLHYGIRVNGIYVDPFAWTTLHVTPK